MPEIYIPSAEVQVLLEGLPFGFLVDINDVGTPVLLLKFDAAILGSIITGSPISLLINNPHITNKSLSLELWDNHKYPMWVDGNIVTRKDKGFSLFDELAIN